MLRSDVTLVHVPRVRGTRSAWKEREQLTMAAISQAVVEDEATRTMMSDDPADDVTEFERVPRQPGR